MVFTKVRAGEGEVKEIKNITVEWVGGRLEKGLSYWLKLRQQRTSSGRHQGV